VRSTWYRGIPAALLIVAAVWSTCRIGAAADGVPSDEAWQRAAAAVRAQHQRGDLVVFAPGWIDPVGRMVLGDLIPVEMAARLDADRYAVIWELAIRGERSAETAGLRAESEIDVGGVVVRRFVREPAVVVTDLVAELARARIEGPRARGPSVEIAEVGFEPRRCIVVVPQAGKTVTMTFADIELGTTIVGAVGLADVFTRRDVREPGEVVVSIGGAEVARTRVGVDDGWVRFSAATTPGRQTVTISATAVGAKARDRLICVAAEARR
jgi:hypothetical protein